MSLTKLDIDRFISTLRTKSKEFNSINNVQLASMLEETISNINEVAYFWATISSDNKGTTKTPAEGEEWVAGPYAAVLATQYYSCLIYTSPSPRYTIRSRMPSSA